VPASPPGPGPAPGTGPGAAETQEQILALEMAAFPGDDEPGWLALEALEYSGTGPGDRQPGDTIPGGTNPGDRQPGDKDPGSRNPGDRRPADGPAGFAQGGPADVLGPGLLLAALAEQAWGDGLGGLDDDELTGVMAAWQRLGARAAAGLLAADKHLSALAQAMKQAGAEGTMDQLRARAYLHLLGGGDPATLLTPQATGTAGDGSPEDGTPGSSGTAEGPVAEGGAGGNGGTPSAAGRGLPALRGSVHLTMPLLAWLGWSQSPGQVPGFGTIDADDSRALAAMLACDPATKWCLTLTDPAGHPIAHGCARHGPRPPGEPAPRPGPGPDHRPGPRAGPGPEDKRQRGPAPPPGTALPADTSWLQNLTLRLLQTGTCTHPCQTPAYRPGTALRHLIEIRHATCTHPGCRRAATRCDMDHTVPFDQGGRTCECNIGPRCRHHHKAKQAPGWTLTQTQPGIMTLTTRSGRTYTTYPTTYPD